MIKPLYQEKSEKTDFWDSKRIVNRNMVLHWLKEDIAFLRKMARNKNPIKNPVRVKLLRASIYGCSVLLSGLKDEELEIRILELEEKLKNGVLIPNEKYK